MPWFKDNLPDSVKNKQWSETQIAAFVATANAIMAKTGDEAQAIATATQQTEEKKNAAQMPRIFYCRHMQPGTCKYENEVVLVDTDAVKKMLPSGLGLPIYVQHQKVNIETLQEDADGYITEAFYNELDGWGWFKVIVVSDEGNRGVDNGWSVSNAYRPTEWGPGGTKNNVPYHREIRNAEFTHLAIVPNPRYEEACIMTPDQFKTYQAKLKLELAEYQNSTASKGTNTMFKFFKNERKEVSSVDEDTMVDIGDGVAVTVKELMNAHTAQKTNAKKNMDDDMIECDGEKVPMKELVSAYKNMKTNEKKNAEEEEAKKKKEEEEKAAKKNESDDEKKKREDKENADKEEKEEADRKSKEEKENSKFFEELKNANAAVASQPTIIEAPQNSILRGSKRYGSGK